MKKSLLIILSLLFAAVGFATTIREVQYTTDASGDSPLKDQIVTIPGIVTGEPYAFGGSKMYIQDAPGAWNGVYVYLGADVSTFVGDSVIVSEGDSVTVTGKVSEYHNLTEIVDVTSFVVEKAGVNSIMPSILTAAEANTEAYEGCLVTIKDVAVSNGDLGYGEWEIADASDSIGVDDEGNAPYYFWPEEYDSLLSITGLINYSYGAYKVIPRLAWDIVEGKKTGEDNVFIRIQRIQQVRESDLMKTVADGVSDKTYLDRDDTTLVVKGVVTMATGLSYAGDGVKFILSDIHGGPWSAILSYNSDASIYADMFAGDLIEMSGYASEYATTPANMTEFFLVGDVDLVGTADLPDTAVVTSGDLRLPVTAEQWGNNIVRVENALVINNSLQYEIMAIDDGTGSCLVDDDSDSLDGYVAPPVMTPIESITGWLYNHYGSFADTTTYKLCPLYKNDIVLGEGPAMLLDPARNPANIPASTDNVVASVLVSSLRNIVTAQVVYRIDNAEFQTADMTEGNGNIWSGSIPAQADGSIVEYYFHIVDDSSDVSNLPSNYDEALYTYKVIDGSVSVYDIQYTFAPSGLSPLHGCDVVFDAYVTSDGMYAGGNDDAGNGIISVASDTGAWNGVFVLMDPAAAATFHAGDLVTVTGKVDDDHEAYWKWQTNTYVVGSVALKLNENALPTTKVTLGDLETNPEAYEGVVIELEDGGKIGSINQYDLTLTSDLGSFLLDDDFVADSVLDINYEENAVVGASDTLFVDSVFTNIKGIVIYSYGSFKIEIRELEDMTLPESGSGDDAINLVPQNFALHQNYPNPFNPITTIGFDLPVNEHVTLNLFDVTGRKVQQLINSSLTSGQYSIQLNASNLSSGVYFYRLKTDSYTATNKMLLLK